MFSLWDAHLLFASPGRNWSALLVVIMVDLHRDEEFTCSHAVSDVEIFGFAGLCVLITAAQYLLQSRHFGLRSKMAKFIFKTEAAHRNRRRSSCRRLRLLPIGCIEPVLSILTRRK